MRASLKVKIEEVIEENAPGAGQGRVKLFKPLENFQDLGECTMRTQLQTYNFPDTLQFEHRVRYEDLAQQYLSFYFYDEGNDGTPAGTKKEPLSIYRVALNLLANGPVHHDVSLFRAGGNCFSSGSAYACRFHANIKFVQTQEIEIQLERLQAKVNTNLKEAY